MKKYPADLLTSLIEDIEDCPFAERYYMGKWINRIITKNQYGLMVDRKGNLTGMGLILCGLRECILFSITEEE